VKSSVEKTTPTHAVLTVEVPFAELQPHIDHAYHSLASKISIPGFRKGKVPKTLIEQRVGRAAVLDEAINDGLGSFYSAALRENKIFTIGGSTIDIKELVDNDKFIFTAEVDIRPDITLPNFSEMTITVDDVEVTDAEVLEQVDSLRARFGSLHALEGRAVENGLFTSIDLVAKINGEAIEGGTANDISYEVGTNRMIDGLDEALIGLNVGESNTFTTQLVGQKDGESGEVTVTVKAVKERELPELNDEFAKMASEFESIEELKADIKKRLDRIKQLEQASQARDLLVEKLTAEVEIPLPTNVVEAEVHAHLDSEGRLEDEAHRAEITESIGKQLLQEILFDNIVEGEDINVTEQELSEYIIRAASRYGMGPEDFVKEVTEAGQVQTMVGEVSRAKALASVLGRVKVVTKSGKAIDIESLNKLPESSNE
jgi:trigger factor